MATDMKRWGALPSDTGPNPPGATAKGEDNRRHASRKAATSSAAGDDDLGGLDLTRHWFTQVFNDETVDYEHRRRQHRIVAPRIAILMLVMWVSDMSEMAFGDLDTSDTLLVVATVLRCIGHLVTVGTALFLWRTGASIVAHPHQPLARGSSVSLACILEYIAPAACLGASSSGFDLPNPPAPRTSTGLFTPAGVLAMELALSVTIVFRSGCGAFIAAKLGDALPGHVYIVTAGVALSGRSWWFHASGGFASLLVCVHVCVHVCVRVCVRACYARVLGFVAVLRARRYFVPPRAPLLQAGAAANAPCCNTTAGQQPQQPPPPTATATTTTTKSSNNNRRHHHSSSNSNKHHQ